MLQDPICGKKVQAGDTSPHTEYKRRKYYFCSSRCKASFEREAERIRLHELMRVGALLTTGKVRWGMA
jgi:YHS domain-containing protein